MSRPRSRFQRFRPRFETLESRRCLAASLTQVGDLLMIRGDESDNQIAVVDAGAEGVWAVLDLDPNEDPVPLLFPGVRRITLAAGGGHDQVDVLLGGPDTLVGKFTANLGAGDDHFSLSLDDLAGKALAVSVAGQGGDDLVGFHWGVMEGSLSLTATGGDGDDYVSFHEVDEFTGSLSIRADGGNGDDAVGMNFTGVLVGSLNVSMSGGNGDDYVAVHEVDELVGSLSIATSGGNGDDVMNFEIQQPDGSLALAAKGGAGHDTLFSRLWLGSGPGDESRSLQLSFDGGAGHDELSHWMESTAADRVDPSDPSAPRDSIFLAMKGGTGDDMIDSFASPGCAADWTRLNQRIEGGDGDDDLVAAFEGYTPNPDDVLTMLGGNGDDQLAILGPNTMPAPDYALLLWLVDGGTGQDEAMVPRGLRTRRIELVLPFGP